MERLQRNSMAVPVPEGGHGVVGCGVPAESTLIQIVDEEGCPVADRHVGQIMIKSLEPADRHLLGGKNRYQLYSPWLACPPEIAATSMRVNCS